ncbi:MAG: LytTR family DNA-binding domain-containing protein [Saprospiraceae bacterium]|nr:LytTR family DNA-binding domain-containing protein [Saprospiraceae bacterium]
MKALIVDDEAKAREVLELMVAVHVPEISEVRCASGASSASSQLTRFQPDLVFLDIKMPGISGFEWLMSLASRPFEVIFTTAFDQYAIQAIRFSAFDYLLKPVDPEELRKTIDRYVLHATDRQSRYENLFYNVEQKHLAKLRLTLTTTERTHYVDPAEIVRCEADGNYTHFYLNNGKRIVTSRPLGHYSTLLPDKMFIRCHKSHIINRMYVESMSDSILLLRDGSQAEVSRRRRGAVREAMQQE